MLEPSVSNGQPVSTITLKLRIETPENVVLAYQLAGPAARLTAYLIDLVLRTALTIGFAFALSPLMVFFPGSAMGFWLVAFFLVQWGYYALCEGLFKGKTPGKHAMGLRVIHTLGHPITFWPAVLRNLVRVADAFPYLFSGVGLAAMTMSKNFQRLGDMAADTVVITERHVVLPTEPVILERIRPIPRDELGGGIPGAEVLVAIEHFLGRRYVLSHERGHEIASILARPLAEHVGYRGDPRQVNDFPMAFLARVYVTYLRRNDAHDDDDVLRRVPEPAGVLT